MRLAAVILALLPSLSAAEGFFTLKGHGGPIKDITVSPGGDTILTASFDYALGLWQDGSPVWLEAHNAAANTVAFIDDRRAVSAGDDFAVYLWELSERQPRLLGHHKGKILGLAISPDLVTVASASWDGTIGLWPIRDGAPRFLKGHTAGVNDVVFSDNGELLYSASADGTIRVWNVSSGNLHRVLLKNGFGINKMVLNDAAGWLAFGAVDGVTHVIDTDTADVLHDFSLDRRPILALAADRGFNNIAIGDGEGYISVISTVDWRFTNDFRATTRGPVWALAFSADGRNIHAGGLDDAMYSWPLDDTKTGQKMVSDDRSFLNGNDPASNGQRQFDRKCSICHTLTPDTARRAGPSLHGLFGRRAGTVADYSYSDTLTDSEIVWADHTIDALFDLGPDVYIQGTKMPMQRITRKQDRDDLIAFLRQFSPSGD